MIYTVKNIGVVTLRLPNYPEYVYNEFLEYIELDNVYKIHVIPYSPDRPLSSAIKWDCFYDNIIGLIEQNSKAHSIVIHLNKRDKKKVNKKLLNIKSRLVKFSWEDSMHSFKFGDLFLVKNKKGFYQQVPLQYLRMPKNNNLWMWMKKNSGI